MFILSNTNRKLRLRRAFVLIDVMVALFVLAIGLLPVATMLMAARALDIKAQYQSVAVNACQLQLETLRAKKFASIAAMSTSGTATSFTVPTSLTSQFPNATFTGTYAITILSTNPYDTSHELAHVVATVSWALAGSTSNTGSYSLDSYIAQGLSKDQ